jgi:Zn-finger nucleic acid-binding protein
MNCPQCSNVALVMSERQGVEIDYCPQCRGVWLDRGELDKIIERSDKFDDDRRTPPPPPVERRDYDRDRDRDDHYRYHKKKSFWHELFD